MKTIGINAHLLSRQQGYRRAGIHHYIAQILRHLPQLDDLRYTIFTSDPPEFLAELPHKIARSAWRTDSPPARILWEQTAWPWAMLRERVDLVHSMAFVTPWLNPRPAIVTVYDLSFVHYPTAFPRAQRLYLHSQTRRSVRRAQHVLTISASGRQDVHEHFGVPLEKISVAYPGVDPQFAPVPPEVVAAFRQTHQLPERFLLHVGTLQPRKNIPLLLEALHQCQRSELELVLVGGKGWLYDEIFGRVQALGLEKRVHFMGYVPDEALPLWYNTAVALTFPSIYEGFGLPIVQALACGTPVIAADVSAMPEAVGEAGWLFPPDDALALAECLRAVCDLDPAQRTAQQVLGVAQAQRFSWASSAAHTAAIYQQYAL
jgi:glycosyltransferase involved in cell wall biosynthesis